MIVDNQDLAEFAALLKAGFNESDWESYTDSFPWQVSPFPEIPDDVWRVALAWNFDKETTCLWLQRSLPALHNTAPLDLLKLDDGLTVLKAFLMRLPW